MSLMEINTDGVLEPRILNAGEEARLRVISVRSGVDKNDENYLMITCEVVDVPEAKEIMYMLYIPSSTMDPKKLNRTKWDWTVFAQATGFDLSRPFEPEDDLIGLEFWAVLGVRKSDEYGDQNTIRKFLSFTR